VLKPQKLPNLRSQMLLPQRKSATNTPFDRPPYTKHRLARSLAALVNILDSDVIVLGDGISNIDTLCAGLPEPIAQYGFSDGIRTRGRSSYARRRQRR
jgi:hypothetical protein